MKNVEKNLDNISIVLNEPRFPENIGAAARCCRNMGISSLAVVRPELPDREKMLKMATHEAADIIENMKIYDSLAEALSGFSHIAATTARQGRGRRATHTPREAAEMIARLSVNNRVAVLFGSEDKGLSNAHLQYCNSIITIPTSDFRSLNLAQSVMVVCYEIFTAGTIDTTPAPRLANQFETSAMYQHLQEMFTAVGLYNESNPDYWINKARRFLGRCKLRSWEVRLVRGLCRHVLNSLKGSPADELPRGPAD